MGTGEEYRLSRAFLTQSNCLGALSRAPGDGRSGKPHWTGRARAGERPQQLASGKHSLPSTG